MGIFGLDNIKKLNQLDAGMSPAQVKQILGEPNQKELKAGRTVLKYSLNQMFVGWKPVYLVFDESQKLVEWFVSDAEFREREKIWMRAFEEMGRNQRNGS